MIENGLLQEVADNIERQAREREPIRTPQWTIDPPDGPYPFEYCPLPINPSTWPVILDMVEAGEAPTHYVRYVEDYLQRRNAVESHEPNTQINL